jgi:hypothetical protein
LMSLTSRECSISRRRPIPLGFLSHCSRAMRDPTVVDSSRSCGKRQSL